MVLNDRAVDLIEEGFDAAIRIGHLTDSTLIARRIAPVHFVLCSSPNYLANRGTPQRPSDLQHHNCVVYSLREGHGEWRFTGPDGEEAVLISGRLKANNGNFLRVAPSLRARESGWPRLSSSVRISRPGGWCH